MAPACARSVPDAAGERLAAGAGWLHDPVQQERRRRCARLAGAELSCHALHHLTC